jgi:hypothetical protein
MAAAETSSAETSFRFDPAPIFERSSQGHEGCTVRSYHRPHNLVAGMGCRKWRYGVVTVSAWATALSYQDCLAEARHDETSSEEPQTGPLSGGPGQQDRPVLE